MTYKNSEAPMIAHRSFGTVTDVLFSEGEV